MPVLLIIIFIIAAIIGMPLALIWSVNTLFNLGIVFTFWNWLATFVIMVVFAPKSK